MVVKSELTSERRAGLVGYRHDGKAIISGIADRCDDHIEFDSSPVYDRVEFGCLCGAPKKITP